MIEAAVSSELLAAILNRIQRFGVPPPLVQRGWVSPWAINRRVSARKRMLLRDAQTPAAAL